MGAPVRVKVMILSMLGAHHTKPHVYLYWTSGGDPSSRLVRGRLVTAPTWEQYDCNQTSTHINVAEFMNLYQIIIVNEHHIAVRCPLHRSR